MLGSARPLAVAAVLGVALVHLLAETPDPTGDAVGARATNDRLVDPATSWLHLLVLVLGIGSVASTIEAWPGFGLGRAGRCAVDRLAPGPLQGCVTAALVAVGLNLLAVLVAWSVLGLLGFGSAGDRDGPVRESTRLRTTDPGPGIPALGPGRPTVTFRLPDDPAFAWVELRPRTLSTDGTPDPARLELRFGADSAARYSEPRTEAVARNGQLVELRRPDGATELRIDRVPGPGLAVAFPEAHASGFRLLHRSRSTNLLLALSNGAASVFAALGLACLLRRQLRRDLLAGAASALLLLLALVGIAPQVPALAAAARHENALAGDTLRAWFWSLSIGGGSMLFGVRSGFLRQPWFRRAT